MRITWQPNLVWFGCHVILLLVFAHLPDSCECPTSHTLFRQLRGPFAAVIDASAIKTHAITKPLFDGQLLFSLLYCFLPLLRPPRRYLNTTAPEKKRKQKREFSRAFISLEKFVSWNEMKCMVSKFKWNEMKWNFSHFSTVHVKWKLMKLFFINDREMRWHEVKFMKFDETRPWKPRKRFIEFYQKSVLVNKVAKLSDLRIFFLISKTYSSSSSSSRTSRPPWSRIYVSTSLNSDNCVSG